MENRLVSYVFIMQGWNIIEDERKEATMIELFQFFSEKTKQFILQQSESWYQHTMIKIW